MMKSTKRHGLTLGLREGRLAGLSVGLVGVFFSFLMVFDGSILSPLLFWLDWDLGAAFFFFTYNIKAT